jgi:hypothetical protein
MKGIKIEGGKLLILDTTNNTWEPLEHGKIREVKTELEELKRRFLSREFAPALKRSYGYFLEECLVRDDAVRISTRVDGRGRIVYRYYSDGVAHKTKDVKEDLGFETEATEDEADFLKSLEERVSERRAREDASGTRKEHESEDENEHESAQRKLYSTAHPGYSALSPQSMKMRKKFISEAVSGKLQARVIKDPVHSVCYGGDTFHAGAFLFARRCRRVRGASCPGELLTSIARHKLLFCPTDGAVKEQAHVPAPDVQLPTAADELPLF